MRKTVAAVLGVVAVAAVVTTAFAAVVFDATTGTGWVGKGDVQMAFSLNNKAMQAAHTRVAFDYESTMEHSWECEWTTGPTHNKERHVQERTTITAVNGTIASDSRKTGQWTGWNLTGFGSQSGSGDAVTPSCPGNAEGGGNSGAKTVVADSFGSISLGGGLYATLDGDRRALQ